MQFAEDLHPVTADDVQLTSLGIDATAGLETTIELTSDHLEVAGNQLILRFEPFELPDGVYRLEFFPSVTGKDGGFFDGNAPGAGYLNSRRICGEGV